MFKKDVCCEGVDLNRNYDMAYVRLHDFNHKPFAVSRRRMPLSTIPVPTNSKEPFHSVSLNRGQFTAAFLR